MIDAEIISFLQFFLSEFLYPMHAVLCTITYNGVDQMDNINFSLLKLITIKQKPEHQSHILLPVRKSFGIKSPRFYKIFFQHTPEVPDERIFLQVPVSCFP